MFGGLGADEETHLMKKKRSGLQNSRSEILTSVKTACVLLQKKVRLPIDDCLYAL